MSKWPGSADVRGNQPPLEMLLVKLSHLGQEPVAGHLTIRANGDLQFVLVGLVHLTNLFDGRNRLGAAEHQWPGQERLYRRHQPHRVHESVVVLVVDQ